MIQNPLLAAVAGEHTRPGGAGAASERLAAAQAPDMNTTSNENLIPIKGFHG
jgi:hypothetical protein